MNQRGVTLIEVLMTVVIGVIAFFPLAMPFVAERGFSITGENQTEAQRDAQVVLRAMAGVARESSAYAYDASVPERIVFTTPGCAGSVIFELHGGGELHWHDCGGNTFALIDGVRSQVTNLTFTPVVANKLVRVSLTVVHSRSAGGPRAQAEVLETELFLRNGA